MSNAYKTKQYLNIELNRNYLHKDNNIYPDFGHKISRGQENIKSVPRILTVTLL